MLERSQVADAEEGRAYKENPWDFYLTANIHPYVHYSLAHLRATARSLLADQTRFRRNFGRLFFYGIDPEEVRRTTVSIGDGRTLRCESIEIINARGITGVAVFGWTHPDRLESEELTREQDALLAKVLASPRTPNKTFDEDEFVLEVSSPYTKVWSSNDVADVQRIYGAAFSHYPRSFTSEFIREELMTGCWVVLVRLRSTGQICAITLVDAAYGFGDITEVATDPAFQGRGLAHAVVKRAVETMREHDVLCYSEVRADSYPMLKVFHSLGFEFRGTMPGHILLDSCFRTTKAESVHHYATLRVFTLPA